MQSTPMSFITLPYSQTQLSIIASSSPLLPENSMFKAWQTQGAPWLPSLNGQGAEFLFFYQ